MEAELLGFYASLRRSSIALPVFVEIIEAAKAEICRPQTAARKIVRVTFAVGKENFNMCCELSFV